MSFDLEYFSRFKETSPIRFNDLDTYGAWVKPEFLVRTLNDNEISKYPVTSEYEGRPDKISHLFYSTTLLDWVIIAFNDASDTLNWPRAGTVINIPKRDSIFPGLE